MKMALFDQELEVACRAAKEAGRVIRGYYETALRVREKGEDNPVTNADLAANKQLKEIILGAYPDDGWLSEETIDSPRRLACSRTWIIDPLDGTKEFIASLPEFCVCVALVVDGIAQVAVNYNPVTDELFHACRDGGTFLNGDRLRVSSCSELEKAVVLASRSEDKRGEWEEFKAHFRVELTGSVAFKLALVAAGRADATFTLTPKNEWDICSGTLLVTEAGGRVTRLGEETLSFNRPDTLLPGLIASNELLHDQILQLIASRTS